eukprot:TRINITY_DN6569_c0_g2_i1.p1 TRINITY_DN6569_c0_g2~~TRINITY_DN6569_c0_g2_i1.p1  ORF type:complete len:1058 (-),score=389.83 TRINITY_DN6569_c0_g2_i1:160-3264(-)
MSEIDQDLYSRQIGTFGMETMGKLIKMDVLIVGMKGLGVEVAKNLILAGPHSVTIADADAVEINDLSTNFYLKESDVGKPRDQCSIGQLAELNPYVKVSVAEGMVCEELFTKFHVVVFTNTPQEKLVQYNEFCRAQNPPIAFLAGSINGIAGYTFSDFGPSFVIRDKDGEQCKSAIVTHIDQGENPVVSVHDGKRLNMYEGDSVVFHEVEGMDINDKEPMEIFDVKPYSFRVKSTSGLGEYKNNGVVEQVKVPTTVSYKSYSDFIVNPYCTPEGLITPDFAKFGRPQQLHVAFQALHMFYAANKHMPKPNDESHCDEVFRLAQQFNADQTEIAAKGEAAIVLEELDEDIIKTVARYASCEITPMASFHGGMLAQEIVKYTGKYTPLQQGFYFDCVEVLPKVKTSIEDHQPEGSRYDDQICIFGREFVTKMKNQQLFMVGAGALGCEFLKGFALMGIGCGEEGMVTCTDMDNIEVSNLNRQFLFRSHDVGSAKSVTACKAAQNMNSDLKIKAMEIPVGNDTEDVFNDDFWENKNIIVNALDNLKARLYVDGKCVFYNLPLLESGTLGTKANTQVVLPLLTESYGDSVDPPEESIPMCTLKNFPHAIEHCIEWSRDLFEGSFTANIQAVEEFVTSPAMFFNKLASEGNINIQRTKLEGVKKLLNLRSGADFKACVKEAVELFHGLYFMEISQLLHNFPLDHVDSHGSPFWSGPKRAPTPIKFNPQDESHLKFIMSAANLFAYALDIVVPEKHLDNAFIAELSSKVSLPAFVPKKVKIAVDEADAAAGMSSDDDSDVVANLSAELKRLSAEELKEFKFQVTEFEKDDDTNHHIDFIGAAANMRARNYKIKEAPRHKVKMIAGKIVPAIATTTCMVTGLVLLELYKIIDQKPLEAFKNSFVNLSMNIFSMCEPLPPKKTISTDFDMMMGGPVKAIPEGFTTWDKELIKQGDLTIRQLLEVIQKRLNVICTMITAGKKCIYGPYLFPDHRNRIDESIATLFEANCEPLPTSRNWILLDLSCEDEEATDCLIPPVVFYFR